MANQSGGGKSGDGVAETAAAAEMRETGPSEAEYREFVGNLDDWQVDELIRFPKRMGIRIVVDFDGDDAALLDQAVDALDTDYIRLAKRAILEAARAAAESAPPGRRRAGHRRAPAAVRAGEAATQSGAGVSGADSSSA